MERGHADINRNVEYDIDSRIINTYRTSKLVYISSICIFLPIVLNEDDNEYNSQLKFLSMIYIYTELLGMIINSFLIYGKWFKKTLRILDLGCKCIWIFFNTYCLTVWRNETKTTDSFLYYFCGCIYVSNEIYIIIMILAIIALRKKCIMLEGTYEERRPLRNTMVLINDATEIELFSNFTGIKNETMCSICFEDFRNEDSLRILPCKHYYHDTCVNNWFENKTTCPICRYDILDV